MSSGESPFSAAKKTPARKPSAAKTARPGAAARQPSSAQQGRAAGGPDKRERILRGAIKVFARKGFYATRVSEIAKAAGVADGTIYLYFKNKDDVLVCIFEDRITRLLEVLRREVAESSSFEERMRRIVGLPPGPAVPAGRAFMFPGLHVLEPEVFDYMDADTVFSITRDTYPRLLAGDRPIFGYVTGARWLTIDTPAALAAADRAFRAAPFRFCGA